MRAAMIAGIVWGMAVAGGTAAERPEPLWVDRIPVRPGGNVIYDDGRVELHPKLLLGGGYDSNVDASGEDSDADADGYVRGLAGLVVTWLPTVADRFTIDSQIEARRYAERDDRDFDGGRASLEWQRESAIGPLAAAAFGGALMDDPLLETGSRVQRARYDGDLRGWLRGTTNTVRLGVAITGEDFLEDAGIFDEHERDYLRPRVGIEWLFGRSDGQTRIGLRVEADRIDYREDDSDYQDGSGLMVVMVADHAVTPFLQLAGYAGGEHRRYDDDFAGDPSFDDHALTRPVGRLLLRWDPEEYTRVDLGVGGTLTPTIEANAAYLLQAWLHVRWRLRRTIGLVGEVDAYDLERSGSPVGDTEHDRTVLVRVGVELLARDGVVIRILGGTDRGDLASGTSYDRYVAHVDAAIVW